MNEGQLIAAVNRRLPKALHTQSMTGTAYGGTPDRYYDGPNDLWVEYKCLPSMPRCGTWNVFPLPDVPKQPQGKLTTLQYRWLLRRYQNGGNAVVIVGLPSKSAILLRTPDEWQADVAITQARTLDEIAKWIQGYCGA